MSARDRPADVPSTVVGGYRLDEPIGVGGAGTVWRARRGASGPVVAVKRLHRVTSAGDDRRSLRHEASILLRLDHPHVVRVLDVVDDGEGVALAMQYCAGGSLADVLDERPHLAPGQVVAVAGPVADALASAHRRGIVHGDVKPANILFTSDGEPLLCDFGVARWTYRSRLDGRDPGGTTGYAAPEVVAGAEPDVAADVFGLGVTCHEALTGFLPAEDPAGPRLAGRPGLPSSLASVIDRATSVRPENRFASADELARTLRAAVAPDEVALPGPRRLAAVGPPTVAGTGPAWGRPVRLTRTFGPRPPAPPLARRQRRRGLLVTAAVLVALVASGGAGAASVLEPEPAPAAPPRPCPTVPRPDGPSGARVVSGDPDGDGCDGWALYDDGVLSIALNPTDLHPHRYRVGRPGDVLLLGDWNCDGVDTPGLYRSRTGEVLLFDDWDATGDGLPPSAVAVATRDGEPAVETHGGCEELVVHPEHA